MLTYGALSVYLSRRGASLAVRRLNVRSASAERGRPRARPRLLEAVDIVRGRMAAQLLERLRLKESVERLLDAAALKWGAAGLLHRSVMFFLAGFAIATA